MPVSRRVFLGQCIALASSAAFAKTVSMPHVVLLGDSIFDNASYTGGQPDVISQVRSFLPAGWKASLLAVDGATTEGIYGQLSRLPKDATHLVLSVGGNDALRQSHLLDLPVKSSAEVLLELDKVVREFETNYRQAVTSCMKTGLPLTLCTVYNGNFPDFNYQRRATVALATFNDAIIRVATEKKMPVIELRHICSKPEDFANPIEPSTVGGAKIAKVIVRMATGSDLSGEGALIVGKQ